VKPLLGRNFERDEKEEGAAPVLLLSYEYWQHSFGGDPTVVGKTFRMNDKAHAVIGVLPPFPQYPQENDVYMTSSACPFRSNPKMVANRQGRMVRMFGRMKPGVTVKQAEADLSSVAANMQKTYPDDYPKDSALAVQATPLKEALTSKARPTMIFLLAAAGFVLLLACANVANLNLARMVKRERELSVRTALGANRVRLFRQLLTESSLLAAGGAMLGLLLAVASLQMLVAFTSRFTTRASEIHIDTVVLLFTLVIAIVVTVVTGTAPAMAHRGDLITNLKEGGSQSTLGGKRGRARSALIVAQVAVSFLLLIGAGLTLRSLINLLRVYPGFDPENVLTMQISLDFAKYTTAQSQLQFADSLLDKIRSMPDVTSAAVSASFPLDQSPSFNGQFLIEGQEADPTAPQASAEFNVVSPDYFKTLQVPLAGGREFNSFDVKDKPPVVIVNQALAEHHWPGANPVGRRVSFDGKTWVQIVGVVGDVRQHGLEQVSGDLMYVPYAQYPQLGPSLVARTSGDPMSIARAAVQHLYEIDPNQPAGRIRSMQQLRADSIAAPRLTANLLGLFALLALAIAAAGIGGVMALAVSQRTHEIGVRMAIGARPIEIVRMVLGQGMGLALGGVAIGVLGALALTRMVKSLLFDVTPTDPLTFFAVAAVLTIAALAACYIPARRAARVDPLRALRTE
jgi:putative ABC transport system permease protein